MEEKVKDVEYWQEVIDTHTKGSGTPQIGRETHPDQGLLDEAAGLTEQQIEAQKSLEIAAWKQRDEIQDDLGNIRSILRDQLDIMKGAEAQAKMPPDVGQPIGQAHGGFVHRFASGGWVPGEGSGDKVRALLEPGEFVIEKNVANRYTSELERLNKGGRISGTFEETFGNVITPPKNNLRNTGKTEGSGDDSADGIGSRSNFRQSNSPSRRGDSLHRIVDRHQKATDKNTHIVYQDVVLRKARMESDKGRVGEAGRTQYLSEGGQSQTSLVRLKQKQQQFDWDRYVAMQKRSFREASPAQQQRYLEDQAKLRTSIAKIGMPSSKSEMHAALANPGNVAGTLMGVSDVISGSIGEAVTLGLVPFFTERKEQGRKLMIASAPGNATMKENNRGQWADAIG